jgi:hypothetical protein
MIIILKKFYQYNVGTDLLYINHKQVYDNIKVGYLTEIMKEFGIQIKSIRPANVTMEKIHYKEEI